MHLSWRSKYEGEVKTLQLKKDPLRHGLGHYEDIEGNVWDVHCVIGATYSADGKPYINARLVTNCPYYSTATNGHSNGFHTWLPYHYEVVNETVEV